MLDPAPCPWPTLGPTLTARSSSSALLTRPGWTAATWYLAPVSGPVYCLGARRDFEFGAAAAAVSAAAAIYSAVALLLAAAAAAVGVVSFSCLSRLNQARVGELQCLLDGLRC